MSAETLGTLQGTAEYVWNGMEGVEPEGGEEEVEAAIVVVPAAAVLSAEGVHQSHAGAAAVPAMVAAAGAEALWTDRHEAQCQTRHQHSDQLLGFLNP